MSDETHIMTRTPVPCSIWDGGNDSECGRDAYLLIASRTVAPGIIPMDGYKWKFQAICQKCVQKIAEDYYPDDLITITEAAKTLGVKTQAISGRIARGDLVAYTDPSATNRSQARRVSRAAVERLIKGRTGEAI